MNRLAAAIRRLAQEPPTPRDIQEALDELDDQNTSVEEARERLEFMGDLYPYEIARLLDDEEVPISQRTEYDMLSENEQLAALRQALGAWRSDDWIEDAFRWIDIGVPPIILGEKSTPFGLSGTIRSTAILDGVGRFIFSTVYNLPIPTWKLTL